MVDLPLQPGTQEYLRFVPQLAGRALKTITDFLLPPQCAGCGEIIEIPGALCGACWSQVDFIAPPLCEQLGIPFPFPAGEGTLSAEAIAAPPAYERARAVARYDHMARRLVHNLKYKDRLECAPLMGKWMLRAGAGLVEKSAFIAPVPLYRARLWRRRSNQAALLSSQIAALSGVCLIEDILTRTRSTRTQVGLSLKQRRRNVAGAFSVKPKWRGIIEGKSVLLVDDVITTGATIDACTKALLGAGAARVNVLAFARVVDPVRLPV